MFGKKKELGFCPLIKEDCKGEKCKFWRMDDCSMALFFETQGVTFFNQVARLDEIEKEEKNIDYSWFEKSNEEELSTELVEYALEQNPDEKYLSHFIQNMFWNVKGLENTYNLPSELKLKTDRIENKAQILFRKKIEAQEKEKLDEIVEQCFSWAKSNGALKLTKSDINAYLMENEISLTQNIKDILYSKVNMKLKND